MPLFDSGTSTSSKGEILTWKCAYCGAENDNAQDFCDGCGDKRPGTVASSIAPPAEDFEEKLEPAEESLAPEDTEEDQEKFEAPEPIAAPEPIVTPEPIEALQPTVPSSGQRYYFVFVNTPAHSLIKSRVAIEFEDFPIISVGRNPENIVVIPDAEVSRKHASLTLDGNRVVLKDLKSSNGTFIYDGKEFQRVSDSVELKPNSLIKFGTNTIVRLISE